MATASEWTSVHGGAAGIAAAGRSHRGLASLVGAASAAIAAIDPARDRRRPSAASPARGSSIRPSWRSLGGFRTGFQAASAARLRGPSSSALRTCATTRSTSAPVMRKCGVKRSELAPPWITPTPCSRMYSSVEPAP